MRKPKRKRRFVKKLVFCLGIVFLVVLIKVKADFPIFSIFTTKETLHDVIVVLDPGHGGYDPGSSSSGYNEKDLTLQIAQLAGTYLENEGVQVHYTREKDVALGENEKSDLKKRVEKANKANPDYVISIHLNATSQNSQASGFEIWKQPQSTSLANHVADALESLHYTTRRDTLDGGQSLYVLRNQEAPSLLVELGFINNDEDRNYISSSAGMDKIAYAIAQGIIKEAQENLLVP